MRAVLMAHGKFGTYTSKTATCVLRYSQDYKTVAILDETKAGQDATKFVGAIGKGVPILASFAESRRLEPEVLIIGIAPVGGALPSAWRREITQALERGLQVISGLHTFLAEDPDLAEAARRGGGRIWDVRRPVKPPRIATGEARFIDAPVVHTMGTDCSSGKMTVSVEMARAAQRRGINAGFAATGQTGIMIGCDAGAPIDRIISDFVAGAAEELVLECAQKGKEIIFVEGQGATTHPAYSGVTVGLMHGCFPDIIVLCHQEGRTTKGEYAEGEHPFPILSFADEIEIIHRLLRPVSGGRVAAIALATYGLPEEEAKAAIDRIEAQTGLPCDDVVRFGADKLLDAVLSACENVPKKGVARLRKSALTRQT